MLFGIPATIALVGLVYFPGVIRIVRAQALTQVNLGYVKAAQLRGENALSVIVREAGGVFTTLDGGPVTLDVRDALAGTPALHAEALALFNT